ncbi:MAG TPA: asparagine synthase (glutamine-hydrolyzing) [Gammaproteobacteria bacterium]|nr:asparagine synthase (glutamine-hydrolyzing) [Gammaproteobacteria bacterium]
MCGIAGILKFDPRERVDEQRLRRMRDVLRHRGPDEQGLMVAGPVGFAHRRLSIIDLTGGRQPMANADHTVWITYNGEIYNFRELRSDLELRGCRFTTESDTEVVLRAYEAFGEKCVERLRGMFAFAIWDRNAHKVFLARDRLGIKPLYYAVANGELLFASEIKAILAAGSIRPAFNKAILPEFLATRFNAGAETFFSDVRKLLPGRTLSWSLDKGFHGQRYWRLPAECEESNDTIEQRAVAVRQRLEESISKHLVSDVPIGLFLSGGIDSSGLAALMASMKREPIRTFSVGFDDPKLSELKYARIAAESIGAVHREVSVSPAEFFGVLPKLIWHEDEPIAFPSSILLYFVSDLARRNDVKVVMSGEGADELFLGYNRYRVTAWNERIGRMYWPVMPSPLRAGIRFAVGALPGSLRRYSKRSFLALGSDPRELFFENFAVFPERMRRQLVSDQVLLRARDPYAIGMRCYREGSADTLQRMAQTDLQTYLVELLMKQDQMSMAASVESRVPFLDHPFVEYAATMPARYKLRGWQTKAVLREALRTSIPRAILTRPKMGFPTPLGRWLRGPFHRLVREFVTGGRAAERGLFDAAYLRRLAEEHRNGRADHGDRLWLLMNLEIWQRVFIEGEVPADLMKNGERLIAAAA